MYVDTYRHINLKINIYKLEKFVYFNLFVKLFSSSN